MSEGIRGGVFFFLLKGGGDENSERNYDDNDDDINLIDEDNCERVNWVGNHQIYQPFCLDGAR